MSVVVNEVRRGLYLDSVALMRISRTLTAIDGVAEAGLMIGTPANKEILAAAGVLGTLGETAAPGDLIVAVRARDGAAADAALAEARRLLDARQHPATGREADRWRPRSIRAALAQMPDARLALISVPGDFAAVEARKALALGLDVMIFSDNVPLADEVALKREAVESGLLVMGPDCGTAIIAGVPLAFANKVPRGDIGLIGASGTGLQEVSCLIANAGRGVSHAIGTGGRDLKAEVGGLTTLAAIDALDADPATRHIVIISKPPAPEVTRRVIERVSRSPKSFTLCLLGLNEAALPANARLAATLEQAAELALGAPGAARSLASAIAHPATRPRGPLIRGLYAGGTLCTEAQLILLGAGLSVASNVPVAGAEMVVGGKAPSSGRHAGSMPPAWPPSPQGEKGSVAARFASSPPGERMPEGQVRGPLPRGEQAQGGSTFHTLLDLGDDEFTRGRPHPMIEPEVRDAPLVDALGDPEVGVVLIDIVLGTGGHMDPAGHVAAEVARVTPAERPIVIASVTGTDGDAQGRAGQIARLAAAGIVVAPSNAAAARLAAAIVTHA